MGPLNNVEHRSKAMPFPHSIAVVLAVAAHILQQVAAAEATSWTDLLSDVDIGVLILAALWLIFGERDV
jgi:ABC-type nickel/cobalt efflux system permease component RcnA